MSVPIRLRERVHSTRFLTLINRMSRLQMMLTDRRAPVRAVRPSVEVELDAVKAHLVRMQADREAYINRLLRGLGIRDRNPITTGDDHV